MASPTASDTTTATGAVQTLCDVTANKYFTFKIDTTAMASGDTLIVIYYDKVLASSGYAIYKTETYVGAQTEPIKYLPPIWVTEKFKVAMQQTTGTMRSYPWVLLEA